MSRFFPVLSAFVLGFSGCVPVSDGAGNIDKAEPDKNLIGSWLSNETEPNRWAVDHPTVKGNPKGLMRVRIVEKGEKLETVTSKDTLWFFTATIGKDTYVDALVGGSNADLSREGGFTKWLEDEKRGYFVGHLKIEKDRVTINPGDYEVFEELMREAEFRKVSKSTIFKTTPGWLTTYLEKTGPKPLFALDRKATIVLTRVRE